MVLRVALAITFLGCAGGCAGISGPSWSQYEPVEMQRARAEFWDPYPENNSAPEATGVRPPEFSKPLPEANRSRWPFAPAP